MRFQFLSLSKGHEIEGIFLLGGEVTNQDHGLAAIDFLLGNKQRTLTRMLSRQLLLPPWIEY